MNLDGGWTSASLVALDLEGTGAQDHDDEAILEIAVVPLAGGRPDISAAYTTLINPGRPVSRRPWISPDLTGDVLASAPDPTEVGPELARRIDDRIIVGHNINVNWRLLHRRHPAITPAALVDTLRLARHFKMSRSNGLAVLIDQLGLTAQINRLAEGSQPHRALWDTIAAGVLLPTLAERAWPDGATLADLLHVAGIEMQATPAAARGRGDAGAGAGAAAGPADRLF